MTAANAKRGLANRVQDCRWPSVAPLPNKTLPLTTERWRSTAATRLSLGQSPRTIFSNLLSTTRGSVSVAAKQLLRDAIEHLREDATVENAMDR